MASGRSSASWPAGLLGAICLVIVAEWCVRAREATEFSTVWAAGWRDSRERANTTADCQILCMGDSLVKFSVFPRVLEESLGLRAINLANCVGQPPTDYYLLKRALAAGAKPRIIIVDFTEHLLCDGPMRNIRHWPELLEPHESLMLALESRNLVLLARLMLAHVFPSVKDRDEIRASVIASFAGKRTPDCEMLSPFRQLWDQNLGAQPVPHVPPKAELAAWYELVYPKRWWCHPVNRKYIDRFLDLAEHHAIQVYWLLSPYRGPFQALCERKGVDGQFERLVRHFVSTHPNLTVLDGRKADYPDALYAGDPIHLGKDASTVFSQDIAQQIASEHGRESMADRWVKLPAYGARDRTGQGPMIAGESARSDQRR
jgi:hypothetical protein